MKVIIDKRPIALLFILRYLKLIALVFLTIIFYLLLQITLEGLSKEGYRIILVFLFSGILWATNLIPPAITALLIFVLIPFLEILPAKKTYALFGNEPLFFILSAFMISIATEKSGLTKRITLLVLEFGANRSNRLILFTFLLGVILSFFMPEHAVALLILPIIMSIADTLQLKKLSSNFGKLLFMSLAYGTIIGGVATFLGGARNALAVGLLEEISGKKFGFFEWIRYSLPLVIMLSLPCNFVLFKLFKPESIMLSDVSKNIRRELDKLPPFTFTELTTAIIILFTIISWIFVGHNGVGFGVISLTSAILFFLFGIISWEDAEKGINWSAIFMYGGALTLGATFSQTDAGSYLIKNLPLISDKFWLFILLLGFVSLFLTEFISNATVVALILPLALKAGSAFEYDLKVITVTNALMSGLAFALPIGTPSHFVCYSSGYFSIKDSLKAGIVMNIFSLLALIICIKFIW